MGFNFSHLCFFLGFYTQNWNLCSLDSFNQFLFYVETEGFEEGICRYHTEHREGGGCQNNGVGEKGAAVSAGASDGQR